jgi:hypothetical protein
MALPLVLMAAGTALQIAGQYSANLAQAQSELANAAFYREQANFARESMFRETDLAERRYEQVRGSQVGAYAYGNVDLSGSAAMTIAGTVAAKFSELQAIRDKGNLDIKLAVLRGNKSAELAGTLQDAGYNTMQAGRTLLTNYGKGLDSMSSPELGDGRGKSSSGPNTSPAFSPSQGSYSGNYSLGNYKYNY